MVIFLVVVFFLPIKGCVRGGRRGRALPRGLLLAPGLAGRAAAGRPARRGHGLGPLAGYESRPSFSMDFSFCPAMFVDVSALPWLEGRGKSSRCCRAAQHRRCSGFLRPPSCFAPVAGGSCVPGGGERRLGEHASSFPKERPRAASRGHRSYRSRGLSSTSGHSRLKARPGRRV